jgi:hypothetical protein
MIITKRFSDRKILSYDFEIMSVQIKKPKIMSFSTRFFFLKKKQGFISIVCPELQTALVLGFCYVFFKSWSGEK